MMTFSSRDVERLSAYLDGQGSASDKARVESRLQSDKAYAALFSELRHNRALLRALPKRRLPRHFMLKPGMVGLKPPLPRAVSALSWASLTAMVVFVFSFGANFLGSLSLGATAPMMAAAPADTARDMGGGQESTQSGTPTPEIMLMTTIQEATPEPFANAPSAASSAKSSTKPVFPWLIILPILALLLISVSVYLRWKAIRVFTRKYKS